MGIKVWVKLQGELDSAALKVVVDETGTTEELLDYCNGLFRTPVKDPRGRPIVRQLLTANGEVVQNGRLHEHDGRTLQLVTVESAPTFVKESKAPRARSATRKTAHRVTQPVARLLAECMDTSHTRVPFRTSASLVAAPAQPPRPRMLSPSRNPVSPVARETLAQLWDSLPSKPRPHLLRENYIHGPGEKLNCIFLGDFAKSAEEDVKGEENAADVVALGESGVAPPEDHTDPSMSEVAKKVAERKRKEEAARKKEAERRKAVEERHRQQAEERKEREEARKAEADKRKAEEAEKKQREAEEKAAKEAARKEKEDRDRAEELERKQFAAEERRKRAEAAKVEDERKKLELQQRKAREAEERKVAEQEKRAEDEKRKREEREKKQASVAEQWHKDEAKRLEEEQKLHQAAEAKKKAADERRREEERRQQELNEKKNQQVAEKRSRDDVRRADEQEKQRAIDATKLLASLAKQIKSEEAAEGPARAVVLSEEETAFASFLSQEKTERADATKRTLERTTREAEIHARVKRAEVALSQLHGDEVMDRDEIQQEEEAVRFRELRAPGSEPVAAKPASAAHSPIADKPPEYYQEF